MVIIYRDRTSDQGTEGRLIVLPEDFRCFVIELPWRNNEPEISCLPPGEYRLIWSRSPKFGKMMYLIEEDIPHRGGFRIHSGNVAGDVRMGFISHSLGCPLLGEKRGVLWGQRAVLVSRPCVRKFEEVMAGREMDLIIKEEGHGV